MTRGRGRWGPTCVKLPKPCGYCMGDVYLGVEGYDGAVCVDCRKQPAKPLAVAMQDANRIDKAQ